MNNHLNIIEKKETEIHIFRLSVLAIFLSLSAVLFSFFKSHPSMPYQIVCVDMNQLLRQKASEIVEKQSKMSSSENDMKVKEQAKAIRSCIDRYADQHNVIIVAKGYVFGSYVKDITDDVRALL